MEGEFHPLCNGGHIFHAFNMDAVNDAEVFANITENICTKTDLGFFAYTKNLTICRKCNKICYGIKNGCIQCGSNDITSYSRVTGYYQRVDNFNNAKQKELDDRRYMNI